MPQTSVLYAILLFFFHHTAPTKIYTLSLHDALPISHTWAFVSPRASSRPRMSPAAWSCEYAFGSVGTSDRKSTRLNSSHPSISYAVFCLKKKKKINQNYL